MITNETYKKAAGESLRFFVDSLIAEKNSLLFVRKSLGASIYRWLRLSPDEVLASSLEV